MRHGNKVNHLGRKTAHRKALLMNLSNALILHKRITTTVAKAKELRKHIEPLINKTKTDSTHNRRILFSYLQDKESIKELFGVIADKVANRPGGYTRIIKLGFRKGDAADIAMIELVDFNDIYVKETKVTTVKTRRGRAKKSEGAIADSNVSEDLVENIASEEVVVEEKTLEEQQDSSNSDESVGIASLEENSNENGAETTIPENADDLKIIEGIGPAIEKLLHAKGIFTFAQIVDTPADDIRGILAEAGSKFSIHDPATWGEQAALLRDGKMDEFKVLAEELKGGKRVD
jgi:large subunit ribosomal protein L17